MNAGIYTSICEEDHIWIDQYLAEIERLRFPFAINLDGCSRQTKLRLIQHRLCAGATSNDNPKKEFDETQKQGILEIISGKGFDWAIPLDMDETFETDFTNRLGQIDTNAYDVINIRWVNLWESKEHIRTDGPFANASRDKFYNLKNYRWRHLQKAVNGPTAFPKNTSRIRRTTIVEPRTFKTDIIACIHWGLMTRELRELHKERWDRIYGKAVGRNPYQWWNHSLDEGNFPPVLEKHNYI